MTRIESNECISLEIRKPNRKEYVEVKKIYRKIGFQWRISPDDYTLIAKQKEKIVGLLKINVDHGYPIMRGLYVAENHRGQGIARKLLNEIEITHEGKELYCLPYAHLKGFYKSFGYEVLEFGKAPEFLKRKLMYNNKPRKKTYNQRKLRIIMRKHFEV